MIYVQAKGRSGSLHEYFFCRAKQEGLCDTKYIPTHVVEDSVVDEYARLKLEPTFEADIRNRLTKALDSEQEDIKATYAALRNQLSEIERREARIIDLAADGTLPSSKIREKLFELALQKNRIEDSLANVEGKIAAGGKLLAAALDQITDTQHYYQAAPDKVRRILNESFYHFFRVAEDGEVSAELNHPFDDIMAAQAAYNAFKSTSTQSSQVSTPSSQIGPISDVSDVLTRNFRATKMAPISRRRLCYWN